MNRLLSFVFFLFPFCAGAQFQGLIVNEFSQGGTGSFQEYIELLVVGRRTCTDSTADLRGWIIDDQNGWYGTINGSPGHYRFKNIANWAAVPYGSIILLYNAADKNTSIILPDDPTDANKDLTYIVPIGNTSTYFEQHASQPSSSTSLNYVYPAATATAGYTATTNQWQFIMGLNNANGDVISLVSPSDRASPAFSIGYGFAVAGGFQNPTVSIPNVGSASNAYLSTGNYIFPGSWVIGPVPFNETPGLPNGGANTNWINAMRLGPPKIIAAISATAVCFSSASQITLLPILQTFFDPTQYSISWDGSPPNNFVGVSNAALPTGAMTISVPAATPAGIYTGYLTVQNASGVSCDVDTFTVIVKPLPPAPVVNISQPTCTSTANIEVLSPSGPGFTFSIDGMNYQAAPSFPISVGGTYTISAKNPEGCVSSAIAVVNHAPGIPAAPVVSILQPTCVNSTGSIILSSVEAGLSYSVDGSNYGNTFGVFSGLAAGTYLVTAKNSQGCVSAPTQAIINPPPINPFVQVNSATICPGTDATLFATIVPSGIYSYSWTVPAGVTNPGDVASFSTNVPGTYSVVVTGSCSATASGSVSINNTATVTADNKQVCAGRTVALTGQPAGGVWSGTGVNGAQFDAGSLAPGSYTVTYTFASNNCSGSANAIVTVNPLPAVPTVSVVNHCNGTSSLAASNYTGTLMWNTGASGTAITVVTAGSYALTQTVNGCTSAAAVAFANPLSKPSAPLITSIQQPNCTSTTGGFSVVSSGSGISYSMDGVNYNNATGQFNGLLPGNYIVTAKSSEGCVSTPTSITIHPAPVIPPVPLVQVVQPSCSAPKGTITVLTPIGPEFDYSINGFVYQASPVFPNLLPGTYLVRVRNLEGCISTTANAQIVPANGTVLTNTTACIKEGETYLFNGQVLTASGTYTTTFARPNNCDSTVQLYLVVARTEHHLIEGCGHVIYNGISYLSSVTLRDTLRSSITACDSLYKVTQVRVHPEPVTDIRVCLPEGQVYNFNGQLLTSSGQYTSRYVTTSGCDSIVHLLLTIANSQMQEFTACGSLVLNGVVYTKDTIVTEAVPSVVTGCDSLIWVKNIRINAKPRLATTEDQTICSGKTIRLQAFANDATIQWPGFGSGSEISVSPASTTTYFVTATSASGCVDSAHVTVKVTDFDLQVTAMPNPVIAGKTIVLKTTSLSPYQVLRWQPSFLVPSAKQQTLTADTTQTVWVWGRSPDGCIDSSMVIMHVDPLGDVYVPDAFTPNGDGVNDHFVIAGGQFKKFRLLILDRWGRVVFQSAERKKGWDGTTGGRVQLPGTYVYLLTVTLSNGRSVERKGTVMLIR